MARKNNGSKTPSQTTVPHQDRFDHGVWIVGPTTAMPIGNPTGIQNPPVKTVTPSRFLEFTNRSHTNGKEEK